MFKRTLLVSAVVLMAAPAAGGKPAKPAPIISATRISNDVKVISADDFEGRGINTPAEPKVIAYVSNAFKQAGVQPGGENGGWTQAVRLRQFDVVQPHLAFNLADGSKIDLQPGANIVISTRGTTSDVAFDKAPLVFAGYGVDAPERGWNDFKGMDVKGKIIVVLINDPDFVQPELNTFGGKAMTYYGRWTYKYEEAARKGAAGVIIIHDKDAASYGWDTVRNSWSGPQFDIVRPDPSLVSPKLESWITHDMADRLFKAAGLDLADLRVKARSKAFQPVAMNVSLSGGYGVQASEVTTHNIVGRIKGSKYPDETVLYSAHWDHLGICAPEAKDKICNGAIDNGTGTAALIELARAFGKTKPERSIVFINFTAEESGLLGSEYYASNPLYPLGKTVAGINMDALHVAGRTHDIEITGAGQSSLEDTLKPLAAKQGRVLVAEGTPEAGHFFRSDHFPLVKRGVPMLDAVSGEDLFKGGKAAGKAAREDYVNNRYHQPGDEWSPNWDLSGLVEDVTLYYQIGKQLANSREWPQWRPTSEFKVARDKTAADRK
jgi:Zn-dependent M28 family amino/carboxypeptidase